MQVTGTYPGLGGDPARAAKATPTGDALRQWHRTGDPTRHMPALADYARHIADYYRR